jgi:hypothetical protein
LALDLGGAAKDLARSVAAAVVHEPVAVTVRNLSSLGPGEAAEIRRLFEAELKAAGQPSADVQLTISENLTEYVLAAEIRRAGEHQVLLESWPRTPAVAAGSKGTPRVTLQRTLLWEEDQPILDAAQSGDATLVLDGGRVLLVQGAAQQAAPIPMTHPWPRDLRGRLSFSGTAFTAWLPGTVCSGSLQPQLSIDCRDSQEPWLLAPGVPAPFSPARNTFEGRVPFSSAAVVGDAWIVSGGQWGGDVAGVQTPCGVRILATRNSGLAEVDSVQPFELTNGAAIPAGPAMEFPGPITALWSNGGSATAVTHDLQTGRYAAYSLAPACGS